MGAFEISVSVLREAASLASTVPYVGAIAGIFLQIIRIKSVTFFFSCLPGGGTLAELVFFGHVTLGSRSLSRGVGRGHVQRCQGRRSCEAF